MLEIEELGVEDFGPCECCGSMSRLVTGLISKSGEPCARYQVHWTTGQAPKHGATFYIILGYWGEGTMPVDSSAVALRYRQDAEATGFMVIDAAGTPISKDPAVGRLLTREQVVDTQLAKQVFDLIDFIWLHDGRISEITDQHKK